MSIKIVLCVFTITAIIQSQASKELPSYFPRCSRDDPNLNQCLVKAANEARPFLVKGIPELRIAPLTPYRMPDITLEQGSGNFYFKATLYNTDVSGLERYEVEQLDYDVKNGIFSGRMHIRNFHLEGNFKLDTKLLAIPLDIGGKFTSDIEKFNSTLKQKVEIVTKNGVKYLKITKIDVHVLVDPKDVSLKMDRLLGSNEILGQIANDIVNQSLDVIIEDVTPIVDLAISKMVENLLEKIHKVPYDQLYPPCPNMDNCKF